MCSVLYGLWYLQIACGSLDDMFIVIVIVTQRICPHEVAYANMDMLLIFVLSLLTSTVFFTA